MFCEIHANTLITQVTFCEIRRRYSPFSRHKLSGNRGILALIQRNKDIHGHYFAVGALTLLSGVEVVVRDNLQRVLHVML